nr:basic proline-rich protein-like [Aegilops tauschii subsp. strangulata]
MTPSPPVVPDSSSTPTAPDPTPSREIPLLRSPCLARGLLPLAPAASRVAPLLSPDLRAAVLPARLPPRARARHAATARCSHSSPSRRPPRSGPAAPCPHARTTSRPRSPAAAAALPPLMRAAPSVEALAASPHPAPAGAPWPRASPPPSPPAAAPPRPPARHLPRRRHPSPSSAVAPAGRAGLPRRQCPGGLVPPCGRVPARVRPFARYGPFGPLTRGPTPENV